MTAITYNPMVVRVGDSIEKCMSVRALRDGGITVTHHYASTAFMRDLDRDDALALHHWLGDHLMRSAATAALGSPEPGLGATNSPDWHPNPDPTPNGPQNGETP